MAPYKADTNNTVNYGPMQGSTAQRQTPLNLIYGYSASDLYSALTHQNQSRNFCPVSSVLSQKCSVSLQERSEVAHAGLNNEWAQADACGKKYP